MKSIKLFQDLDERRCYETPRQPQEPVTALEVRVQCYSEVFGIGDLRSSDLHLDQADVSEQNVAECYVIPSYLTPSLLEIETWALETLEERRPSFLSLGFLRSAFMNFAQMYCTSCKELPLVSHAKGNVDRESQMAYLNS